jgi:diamine N-acetyltransferase
VTVTLKEIDRDNWRQAIRLDVTPEQRVFVAHNLYSIAESKFDPTFVPLAIHNEAGTMVGFLMYGVENDELWILRLMVDQQYQGRGYGRLAMEEVIRQLADEPDCEAIFTSYKPDNHAADRLYRSLGFKGTGRVEDGELVVRLSLAKQTWQLVGE